MSGGQAVNINDTNTLDPLKKRSNERNSGGWGRFDNEGLSKGKAMMGGTNQIDSLLRRSLS